MLDEMFQQNALKFAIFLEYENPCSISSLFISCYLFFPLMNALIYVNINQGIHQWKKNKVAPNEKQKKQLQVFIYKIWQILKGFAGTFHQAYTFFSEECTICLLLRYLHKRQQDYVIYTNKRYLCMQLPCTTLLPFADLHMNILPFFFIQNSRYIKDFC